jgi:hypothetical protein
LGSINEKSHITWKKIIPRLERDYRSSIDHPAALGHLFLVDTVSKEIALLW